MSRVCICVLCGLPGAGKSRVVQELKQFFHDRPYYLHVFDYDALGIVPDPDEGGNWKAKRAAVLNDMDGLVERLLHLGDGSGQHVVCVDDNMYYRSMRAAVARIAGRHCAGYVQIHVATSADICLARDSRRAPGTQVGEAVIRAMAARFQPPSPHVRWESRTLVMQSCDNDQSCDLAETMHAVASAIDAAMADPLQPRPAVDGEALARARATTDASVVHAIDLALRQAAGDAIRRYHTGHGDVREFAAQANEVRGRVLARVRRGECVLGQHCAGDLCEHVDADADKEAMIAICTAAFHKMMQ